MATSREKLQIAGASLGLLMVCACLGFARLNPIPVSERPHRTDEPTPPTSPQKRNTTAGQIIATGASTGVRQEYGSVPARPEIAQQVASVAGRVDELATEISSLKDTQWRLEALVHNLAVSVGQPGVNVPSYEEHRDTLAKFEVELATQKQTIEALRRRAVEAARSLGMAESTVDSNIDHDLVLPGRNVSEFNEVKARLLNAKKIFEAMEKRSSHWKQLYTLPPAQNGR